MSRQAENVFKSFLRATGRWKTARLGAPEAPEDKQVMGDPSQGIGRFIDASQRQGTLLVLYVAMIVVVFALGVLGGVYVLARTGLTLGALGILVAMLLGILTRMRRAWLDKAMLELALTLLKDLPGREAVQIIEVLYWNAVRTHRK